MGVIVRTVLIVFKFDSFKNFVDLKFSDESGSFKNFVDLKFSDESYL